jgi:hypothetical protein
MQGAGAGAGAGAKKEQVQEQDQERVLAQVPVRMPSCVLRGNTSKPPGARGAKKKGGGGRARKGLGSQSQPL